MLRFIQSRTIHTVALCLGSFGLGSALHVPAVAAQAYQTIVAPLIIGSCSGTTACDQQTNSGAGPGFKGISAGGNGTVGQTEFKSTSSSNFHAGVVGQDISTSGSFDAGVFGKSSIGVGVEGSSVDGNGVRALSTNQSALYAQSTTADGVQSVSLKNDGTNSSTQNESITSGSGRSGVWGHDDATDGGRMNVGVEGSSTSGIGVQANSTGFVGLNVVGGDMTANVPALDVVSGPGNPTYLMMACANASDNPCNRSSGSLAFWLDKSGNMTIGGILTTDGSCNTGCVARGNVARRVMSYAESQTVPSIEDFGEAQLANGRASVALAADFANVVDPRTSYLVFLTPEGDTKGLFVTQKTPAGFVVRECQGGHSTLAFSYRIVAKPFGVDRPRLPMEIRQIGSRP